jgi:NAD(P)-dependent dehydrogenase (short-subunit alcohol dehydrogenase family)
VKPLEGRVALVTGAGRGVGLGIAHELAEAGASLAINDLHAQRAAAGAEEIRSVGAKAASVAFDITDLNAVRKGVEEAEALLGPVDILINNAGLPDGGVEMGDFKDSDPSIWHLWIDLNIYGSLNMVWTVLPRMVKRRWGRIVQISSGVAARGILGGNSIYGGSKAGIDGALRHIAIEEARNGVTVNSIAPGLMTNAANRQDPNDTRPGTLGAVPMGKLCEPRWIGACAVWLCSESGGFVTGQTIHVNGGTIQGR